MPSYCDRILWKGKFVEQIRYQSHGDFVLSDHKPISAYFKIGVSSTQYLENYFEWYKDHSALCFCGVSNDNLPTYFYSVTLG